MPHPTLIDAFGRTDAGLARARNEDQFLVAEVSRTMRVRQTSLPSCEHIPIAGERRGHLLAVADGMGGAPAGNRASALAVHALIRYVLDTLPRALRLEKGGEELLLAVDACRSQIESDVADHPELLGMGTTLTLAYVIPPRVYVVHVGDSRCYLLRNGTLTQVTRDHSLAQKLADRGALPQDEVGESSLSSVIWNVIGGGVTAVEPELHRLDLLDGDALLLCTDGVSRHLPDADLADLLEGVSAEEACRRIIDGANLAGGSDNLTAVVARFDDRAAVSNSAFAEAAAVDATLL